MLDQADGLRRMMMGRRSAPAISGRRGGKMVVVTSGKGGVGKTSLATNLAVASAMLGRDVLLVDADFGLANVDILLGLTPRVAISDVMAGRCSFADAVVKGPAGIRVLPGASGISSMANMGRPERMRFVEGLRGLAAGVDLVVVDTGAGIGDGVVRLGAEADEVIVVSTTEATAVTDAYATLKVIWQSGGAAKSWVWINMARGALEGDRMAERISSVARRFLGGLMVGRLATIEDDPAVRRAVRLREPFVTGSPRSQAARSVSAAARAVNGRMSSGLDIVGRLGRLLAG
jgi:flagellar biosynthesis protein FlhG